MVESTQSNSDPETSPVTVPEATPRPGSTHEPLQSTTKDRVRGTTKDRVRSTTSSPLQTDQGKTLVTEQVVQKVAGMACREVPGVYAMGSNTRRMLNNITERIPRSQTNVTSGVSVQKGERQTAIDVSIVLEYGYSVVEVAARIRQNVIAAVEYATGLEVVEVNIEVTDVKLPGDDDPRADEEPSRSKPELA